MQKKLLPQKNKLLSDDEDIIEHHRMVYRISYSENLEWEQDWEPPFGWLSFNVKIVAFILY